jgi:hypothetical protein
VKILHIAVHSHIGWGSEYWLARSFEALGHSVIRYDYRARRKSFKSWRQIGKELKQLEIDNQPDIILLQRARSMKPAALQKLSKPIVFWSTEPLQLKTCVDAMLRSSLFAWVYVHTYSCVERVKKEFSHQIPICSVMHNACPQSIIVDSEKRRTRFAIFNRTLSARRSSWLQPSQSMVEVLEGRYGEEYFNDLQQSSIALNIHFSDRNLDDFETGIFEAMAKGCAVVSETLHHQTICDLNMQDAYISVSSPQEMKEALVRLHSSPPLIEEYREKALKAIKHNTWDTRAKQFVSKFEELLQRINK